jgi:hypothetical protein
MLHVRMAAVMWFSLLESLLVDSQQRMAQLFVLQHLVVASIRTRLQHEEESRVFR